MGSEKHNKLVEALGEEIRSGKFAASGRSFPSERALAMRFGVSRVTVRLALQELRGHGLIVPCVGKGTFLTPRARKLGGTIGLIVPALAGSEYAPAIMSAVARLAHAHGYVLLFTELSSLKPEDQAQQVKSFAAELLARQVVGVLYQPLENFPDAVRWNREITACFVNAGIPLVLFGCDIAMPLEARSDFDVVGIDNADAGRRLVRHLLERGARDIHFQMRSNSASAYYDRLEGVAAAVLGAGLPFDRRKNVLVADPSNLAALRRHLRQGRPDAFICGSDTMAGYFRQTLARAGLSVPEDVLLAGFNDLQVARLLSPPLTTVHQPCDEVAETAFRFLVERMSGARITPRRCLLSAPLVVRASTERPVGMPRGEVKSMSKPKRKTKQESRA